MTRRDESGAVAVLVSLLSVVLFGVAALSVDLGRTWAAKRAVQRQVDVSALSAGYLLPATSTNRTSIVAEVASYLNANLVAGQQQVTTTALADHDYSNGEVTFKDAVGAPCSEECVRMTVHAPAARVDFGLAGVLGESGADVQRAASVLVGAALPSPEDILPFWLPSGCAFGPAMADSDAGTDGGSPSTTGTTGTHTIQGPAYTRPSGSSGAVSGIQITQLPSNVDRASIRFTAPDTTTFVDYAAQPVGKADPLEVPDFLVGSEVTSLPGTWKVQALVQQRGTAQVSLSQNSLTFTVTGSTTSGESSAQAPAPVGCVGQNRGNFGQLASPRTGVTGRDHALALNIASGLDHQLVPYVFAPGAAPAKECVSPAGGILPGAALDDVSLDGRNCIVADPGNNGPALLSGLVTGVDGIPGRLAESRGPTTCPDRPALVVEGVPLNNDTLACFLRPGVTLDDIAHPTDVTSAMMDPAILGSPRLVWLPVVHATDRAQKRFQPIRHFAPGFITSETQASGPTDTNGLTVSGGTVRSLQVFVFDEAALPVDPRAPTVAHSPDAPSVVRLVG